MIDLLKNLAFWGGVIVGLLAFIAFVGYGLFWWWRSRRTSSRTSTSARPTSRRRSWSSSINQQIARLTREVRRLGGRTSRPAPRPTSTTSATTTTKRWSPKKKKTGIGQWLLYAIPGVLAVLALWAFLKKAFSFGGHVLHSMFGSLHSATADLPSVWTWLAGIGAIIAIVLVIWLLSTLFGRRRTVAHVHTSHATHTEHHSGGGHHGPGFLGSIGNGLGWGVGILLLLAILWMTKPGWQILQRDGLLPGEAPPPAHPAMMVKYEPPPVVPPKSVRVTMPGSDSPKFSETVLSHGFQMCRPTPGVHAYEVEYLVSGTTEDFQPYPEEGQPHGDGEHYRNLDNTKKTILVCFTNPGEECPSVCPDP